MKPKYVISILSLCAITADASAAICRYTTAANKQEVVHIDASRVISVPRDTPNGTVLYESSPYNNTSISDYTCSGPHPWGIKNNVGTDTPTTDSFPVGDTGISWQYILRGTARKGYGSFTEGSGAWTYGTSTTVIRLIKTGDIKLGATVPAGEIGYIKTDVLYPVAISLNHEIKIEASSCETPDIKVDMGKHDLYIFSEAGAHSNSVNFNIKLNNCAAGIKKVTYSLVPTSTAPAWNASMGIVELHASSTAKGIGLQIIDSSDQPVQLNKTYTFNNFSSAGGNFIIPMAARYFRTLPTGKFGYNDTGMSAGSANSDISFVISYL